MPLNLDQLIFDPTGPSAGANVGAFLRDNAGNLLTSTLISTHQALDVNVVSPISTTPESDATPATQAVTAQDTGSTVTAGANGQSIITGTPTAASTASFSFSTQTSIRVQVTGTWTGTLQSEISLDGGTTWYVVGLHQNGTGISAGSSWTGNFEAVGTVVAATNWRLRATAVWTGTATVKVIESVNEHFVYVGNAIRLADSTNGNEGTIKAATTAAAAGDTSLVVGLSPNSPLPAGSNNIGSVNQGTTPWVDNLTQVGGAAISLGQKIMSASFPVVIASDQTPVQVVGNVADNAADTGNPVKVGTRVAFGAALSAVSASADRADLLSDRYRRLMVTDAGDVGVKPTQVSVGTTAQALLGSQLQGRMKIYVQNKSTKATLYLGKDSSVTSTGSTGGLAIPAGAVFEESIGEDVSLWIISDTASTDTRVFEVA